MAGAEAPAPLRRKGLLELSVGWAIVCGLDQGREKAMEVEGASVLCRAMC